MKRLSIKMRVTLWYTGLIVLVTAFVMAFIFTTSDQLLSFRAESDLKNTVSDMADELDWENGNVTIEDETDLFEDGVYLVLYDPKGQVLKGQEPSQFPKAEFAAQQVQRIEQNGQEWLIYDQAASSGNQSVWIRGILSTSTIASATNAILIMSFILLPFLVILAAVGGYFITKRAFKPVEKMIQTVSHMNDGNDLTKRIDLPDTHDEIAELAVTFNGMFDRLQHSFEGERQFTSDASHELRTPTSVIISQAEYGLSQEKNPEEMKNSLQVILKQGRKMSSLVSQLLMMARNDRMKDQFHPERINLSELAEIIVEELSETAEATGIKITQEIEPDIELKADQTLMTRLFVNLISNAITYGKDGGWVHVSLHRENDKIIGKVSDNGIGMKQEHLDKIWDRFYRIDPSRTANASHNLGLGLSMVKQIIHVHEGTIAVHSQPGEGSEFVFTLPEHHK